MSTWKTIPTVNDATVKNTTTDKKRSTNFNSLMTNTPNRTIEELKKHSEELFAAQELENQKLRMKLASKDADRDELDQLVRDARALVNENNYYGDDNYSYRRVA